MASDSPAPTIAWAIAFDRRAARAARTRTPPSSMRRLTAPTIWPRRPATSSASGRAELSSREQHHPALAVLLDEGQKLGDAVAAWRRGASDRDACREQALDELAPGPIDVGRRRAPPWSRSRRTASALRPRPARRSRPSRSRGSRRRANTVPGDVEDQPLALGARHPAGAGRDAGPGLPPGWATLVKTSQLKLPGGYYSSVVAPGVAHAGTRSTPQRPPDPAAGAEGCSRRSAPRCSPDDYLELINPLWSTRELRGQIEEIQPETDDAATVVIKPGYQLVGPRARPVPAHRARHQRRAPLARLLAHLRPMAARTADHITIKNVDEGKVSPYLVRRGRPGTIVSLGGVEGDFVLPDELPPTSSCSSAPAAASRRS